jgi:hypothetical protein
MVRTTPFDGTLDAPGGPVVSAGNGDVVVAGLHHSMNDLVIDWLVTGGDGQEQVATTLALEPSHVYVAGSLEGTLDLGDGPTLGGTEALRQAFVTKLVR